MKIKICNYLLSILALLNLSHVIQASDKPEDSIYVKTINNNIFSYRKELPHQESQQEINSLKNDTLNRATGCDYNLNLKKKASDGLKTEMRKFIDQSVMNDRHNDQWTSTLRVTHNKDYLDNSVYVHHLAWIVINYIKSWSITTNPSLILNNSIVDNIYNNRMNVFINYINIDNGIIHQDIYQYLAYCNKSTFENCIDSHNLMTMYTDLSRMMPDVDERTQNYVYLKDIETGYVPKDPKYIDKNRTYTIIRNSIDSRIIVELEPHLSNQYTVPMIDHNGKIYISYEDHISDYLSNDLPKELMMYILELADSPETILKMRKMSRYFKSIIPHISERDLRNNFKEINSKYPWDFIIKNMNCISKEIATDKLMTIYCSRFTNAPCTDPQFIEPFINGKYSTINLLNYLNNSIVYYIDKHTNKFINSNTFKIHFHPKTDNVYTMDITRISDLCAWFFWHVKGVINLNEVSNPQFYINLCMMLMYAHDFKKYWIKTGIKFSHYESRNIASDTYDELQNLIINECANNSVVSNKIEFQSLLALQYYLKDDFDKAKNILTRDQLRYDDTAQDYLRFINIVNDLSKVDIEGKIWFHTLISKVHNYSDMNKWLAVTDYFEERYKYAINSISLRKIIHTYIDRLYGLDSNNNKEFNNALRQYITWANNWINSQDLSQSETEENVNTLKTIIAILEKNGIKGIDSLKKS